MSKVEPITTSVHYHSGSHTEESSLTFRSGQKPADDADCSARSYQPNSDGKTKLVTAAILITELCERMTYYSISGNLVLFCDAKLKLDGSSQIALIFTGLVYFIPILGGYIADTVTGRFNSIFGSCMIYILGLVSLLFSALPVIDDNNDPFKLDLLPKRVVFFFGLFLIAIGTGGIKANVSPFGAQQLEHKGDKAIQTFFNWFYWFINLGALIAYLGVTTLQQEKSFFYGFLVPLLSMVLALIIFYSPKNIYVHDEPKGNALKTYFSVYFCAIRNYFRSNLKYPTLLDHARLANGGSFTDEDVDNSRIVTRMVPIFLCLIVFWTIYNQMQTTFFFQGERLNLNLTSSGARLSVASLNSFNTIIILIATPIIDRVIFPCLRKISIKPRVLQRMGFGMLMAVFSVMVAGGLEIIRKNSMNNGNYFIQDISNKNYNSSTISIFSQIPQFMFIGLGEIFTSITGLEFAFSEAPKTLKSVIMGICLLTSSLGSFLGALLVEIVNAATSNPQWLPEEINDGKLENFFFLLAGLMFLNFLVFIPIARSYKYVNEDKSKSDVPMKFEKELSVHSITYINDDR